MKKAIINKKKMNKKLINRILLLFNNKLKKLCLNLYDKHNYCQFKKK